MDINTAIGVFRAGLWAAWEKYVYEAFPGTADRILDTARGDPNTLILHRDFKKWQKFALYDDNDVAFVLRDDVHDFAMLEAVSPRARGWPTPGTELRLIRARREGERDRLVARHYKGGGGVEGNEAKPPASVEEYLAAQNGTITFGRGTVQEAATLARQAAPRLVIRATPLPSATPVDSRGVRYYTKQRGAVRIESWVS